MGRPCRLSSAQRLEQIVAGRGFPEAIVEARRSPDTDERTQVFRAEDGNVRARLMFSRACENDRSVCLDSG